MTTRPYHLLPALLMLATSTLCAQAAPAVLVYHFEHAGLPVPEFTLTVKEDGTGTYAATYTAPPLDSRYASPSAVVAPPTNTTRPITLTPATTARLFERVRSTNHFQGGCESKQKNIANSGAKSISYTGSDGNATCTFNYTENKSVSSVSDTFQAIAETLDEGRSIDLKHRYDRLGLDRELANLADAVHDGRAVEVATIAPILQSLLDDSQVMERVRKRAAGLLEASANAH